jgi:hypothetical protein
LERGVIKSARPEKFAEQIFGAVEHWTLEQWTRLTLRSNAQMIYFLQKARASMTAGFFVFEVIPC